MSYTYAEQRPELGAYVGRDPLSELMEKVGADRVIPVELPRPEQMPEEPSP